MAEVTRVPIQPIAKGSLTKLWLGVIAAVLLGAGLASAALPETIDLTEITAGTGPNPNPEDVVFVKYVGKLPDGTEFDRSEPFPWPVPGVFPEVRPNQANGFIPGFSQALLQMQKGGKYEVEIPAELGYGAFPPPGSSIPPNSDLVFEVELVEFMTEADADRRIQVMQQMMQMQQGQGEPAGPGGLPPQP